MIQKYRYVEMKKGDQKTNRILACLALFAIFGVTMFFYMRGDKGESLARLSRAVFAFKPTHGLSRLDQIDWQKKGVGGR